MACVLNIVGRMGSALELSGMQRFVPEPYGLEDDQRSVGYDEADYGMGPAIHYGTVPRNQQAFNHGPPRRTGYMPQCVWRECVRGTFLLVYLCSNVWSPSLYL